MQYLLMIYQNETEYAKNDAATTQKMTAEYEAFTQSIIQSGNFKAADRLRPTATATTVRVRDGKVLLTDGPYIEGAEVANGFYYINAADRDEAIKVASMIPATSVELRRLAGVSGL